MRRIGDTLINAYGYANEKVNQGISGFEHGAAELNKQLAGIEDTARVMRGKDSKRAGFIRDLTRYQKSREQSMGDVGNFTSTMTQMAPQAISAPFLGPTGILLSGAVQATGDTAQMQIDKYGRPDPASVIQHGLGSGLLDYNLNKYTRGLSGRIGSPEVGYLLRGAESFGSHTGQNIISALGSGGEAEIEYPRGILYNE